MFYMGQITIFNYMENKQIFYKIGQLPSRNTVHFDEKADEQSGFPQPDSAIQMKVKSQTKEEEINTLHFQHLQSIKQSLSLQNSLKKNQKRHKRKKTSNQSQPKQEDAVNERVKFIDKPEMPKLLKIRELIRLFHEKATFNSLLRNPVSFNPFENVFSKQNNSCFKTFNFQSYKKTVNAIYITKIVFAVLYFFTYPLTLLYNSLAESLFMSALRFMAIILSSFDLLQTLQSKYSADSNSPLNKGKYQNFAREKRRTIAFQFFILFCSTISLIFNDSYQANLLLIVVSFNISHLTQQINSLEKQFLTAAYVHRYWNLLKVIAKNLFVCHLLACCLIAVSLVNTEQNWMTPNGIDQLPWFEQYFWSYYFGTTIILTIGFGDLHPNNTAEAFFIIVISFFACVFFGYNINYIGNLINSIKEDENEKNTKLKLLNALSKKAAISKGVYNDIARYIAEEAKIRQLSNCGEEKKLLRELPQSLRSSFLQQANGKLFNHLKSLIPLTNAAVERLSLKIEARFCHPNQLIKGSDTAPSIIILQSGELGYITRSKYPCKLKNAIIQRIANTVASESKLVCADLLLDSPLNYDIKSLDYSVIYEMDKATFEESIIESKKDYQIYRSILDRCKFKLNEFALVECRFCQGKMHSLFECPRVHYQPFRKTLPLKSIKSNNNSKQQRVKLVRNKKVIHREVIIHSKIFSQAQISKEETQRSGTVIISHGGQVNQNPICFYQNNLNQSSQNIDLTIQMVGQLKSEIQRLKRNSFNVFQFTLWDNTDCDSACNFQYYFHKWNPDYIREKQVKSTLLGKTTRIKRKPRQGSN